MKTAKSQAKIDDLARYVQGRMILTVAMRLQVTRITPGERRFLNVHTPLQLGGRSNAAGFAFPPDAQFDGFDGCIKHLRHDGRVFGCFLYAHGFHYALVAVV